MGLWRTAGPADRCPQGQRIVNKAGAGNELLPKYLSAISGVWLMLIHLKPRRHPNPGVSGSKAGLFSQVSQT
jgi:hypothetical protein